MENQIIFTTFDKNNKDHIIALKSMLKDEEITERFQGFLPKLSNKSIDIFNKGFWVVHNNQIVGYLDVSNYNKEENCIYLRGAIFKEFRDKHLGTDMLNNACKLIFSKYPFINQIKLKIADDNITSQKIAANAGFKWEKDDFYYLENPYIEKKSLH